MDMRTSTVLILMLPALALVVALPAWADEVLGPPVRLESAEGPIDVTVGHAAPFVCDWDGDGVRDLLVGQFGGGKLRIYLNEGTDGEPRLADFVPFMVRTADGKVGESEGTVPTG